MFVESSLYEMSWDKEDDDAIRSAVDAALERAIKAWLAELYETVGKWTLRGLLGIVVAILAAVAIRLGLAGDLMGLKSSVHSAVAPATLMGMVARTKINAGDD